MKPLRIFVSSPMDVSSERTIARRVIDRLAVEYAYFFQIEPVMSELEPMTATQTPQASITPPSETDIVVVLVWARLGTPLPSDHRFAIEGSDRSPTGTEWEFYDALRAHQAKGSPELLVYRKTQRPMADLTDVETAMKEVHQKRDLEQFFVRWFRNSDGTWKAWFHSFEREEDLEHLLDLHLRKMIQDRIGPDPATDDTPSRKVIEGNPYRGLKSFDIEDAPLFFGRTRALNELREVLDTQNMLRRGFVIVTGGSGSGKSSLVKAGLLADLKNPYRVGRVALCRHGIMRPSDQSGRLMHAVAHALMSPTGFPELEKVGWTRDEMARVAAAEPQRLVEALRHSAGVAARAERLTDASEVRLCLVIDQLEELFVAGIPRSAINEFTRLITLFARSEVVWVVATLRSDFYHRLDETPDLLLLTERGMNRLKPPLPAELGQMIYKPAQLAGLRFEKHPQTGVSLDAVLQDDAVTDPTALPLLEFALTELWYQRSPSGMLTFDAYERMGRLTGAIAERAEGLIATMSPGTQVHLAPTLRSLITVARSDTAPTAATVARSRVAVTPERAEILDRLIEARLVVTDDLENRGDPKCRLAHERLIETWPRLRKLADSDRAFLEIRGRLRAEAENWITKSRKNDFLLPSGSQLLEGEVTVKNRQDELDALTIEFVKESTKVADGARSRKLHRTQAVAVAFAAFSVGVAGLLLANVAKDSALKVETEKARSEAKKASHGFALAIDAASTLAQSAGTTGGNIERVLDRADQLLESTIASDASDATASDVRERRAALLLSFAATSERLGDYASQRERVFTARALLDRECGGVVERKSCRALLADSYEVEGNYLRNVDNPKDAVREYLHSLELRPLDVASVDKATSLLAKARTQAALSQAYIKIEDHVSALTAADDCLASVRMADIDASPPLKQFAEGNCSLAKSLALRSDKTITTIEDQRLEAALRHAGIAKQRFDALVKQAPHDVSMKEGLARSTLAIAVTFEIKKLNRDAETQLQEAVRILLPMVRNNPQNDQIADLLQMVYDRQDTIYDKLERADLAAVSNEERLNLAKGRLGSPRTSHWQTVQLGAMHYLRLRYDTLTRPKDALLIAESEIALRTAALALDEKASPAPIALMQILLKAAEHAASARDGAKAASYYHAVVGHSERHLALLAIKRDNDGGHNAYSNFYSWVYESIIGMSALDAGMLPHGQELDILGRIAARVTQSAQDEPQTVDLQLARGRIQNQLAVVYDRIGDAQKAREFHEQASKAGNRNSTVVLRRWYQEGFKNILPDAVRARELEEVAKKQSQPRSRWRIDAQHRETKELQSRDLDFGELDNFDSMLASEERRIAKYYNLEINEAGRKVVENIRQLAIKEKRTVATLLEQVRKDSKSESEQSGGSQSPTENAARTALKLIDSKRLDEAHKILLDAKNKVIEQAKVSGGASEIAVAWLRLMEGFNAVMTAATAAGDTSLVRQSDEQFYNGFKYLVSLTADGSSPRLRLANEIGTIAAVLAQIPGRERAAISLYEYANTLRIAVRLDDLKNAQCACAMAHNYREISKIELKLGNSDAALASEHRALRIYEELDRLEQGWSPFVAVTSQAIAKLYGDQREPRSALQHALIVLDIRRGANDHHSADSDKRLEYAEALEATAAHAWTLANAGAASNDAKLKVEVDRYFAQATANLREASAIRQSILDVDPGRAECSCQIGNNLGKLGKIYKEWGKPLEFDAAHLAAIQSDRLTVTLRPEVPEFRLNLAERLRGYARLQSRTDFETQKIVVAMLVEAIEQLRILIRSKDHRENATTLLKDDLLSLSFHRLFIKDPKGALEAADEGLTLHAQGYENLFFQTNRAHALMYTGAIGAAKALYLEHRGTKLGSGTWDDGIIGDFAALKSAGLANTLMDSIVPLMRPTKAATIGKE